jgi:hypothetical protein
MRPPLVPLATLIGRELRNEKIEKPFVKYGQAALAKKGEDYFLIKPDCQRVPGDLSTSFSVFAVLPFFFVHVIYLLIQEMILHGLRESSRRERKDQIIYNSNKKSESPSFLLLSQIVGDY